MPTIKGVAYFTNKLFTPKRMKDAGGNETGDPSYGLELLIPPGDPQINTLQQLVDEAKANTFPSGFPANASCCFLPYDTKYSGKDYYDPRFTGWHVLSTSAKEDDKPAVVYQDHSPVVDPGDVCSGTLIWMNVGISGFTKGKGGVGGWLNGVMTTKELCEHGRLDGKPSVDQMFAGVGDAPAAAPQAPTTPAPQASTAPVAAPPVAPAPAAPTPPVPPAAPPAAPQYQMTAAANGATREQMHAAGWTDETLIAHGMMLPPNGVTPSFA